MPRLSMPPGSPSRRSMHACSPPSWPWRWDARAWPGPSFEGPGRGAGGRRSRSRPGRAGRGHVALAAGNRRGADRPSVPGCEWSTVPHHPGATELRGDAFGDVWSWPGSASAWRWRTATPGRSSPGRSGAEQARRSYGRPGHPTMPGWRRASERSRRVAEMEAEAAAGRPTGGLLAARPRRKRLSRPPGVRPACWPPRPPRRLRSTSCCEPRRRRPRRAVEHDGAVFGVSVRRGRVAAPPRPSPTSAPSLTAALLPAATGLPLRVGGRPRRRAQRRQLRRQGPRRPPPRPAGPR